MCTDTNAPHDCSGQDDDTDRWDLYDERRARAASFRQIGSDYEKYRPDQPDEVTAWMIGDARQVLDLGAGTGKLTDSLLRLGREVRAVDPASSMLSELTRKHPELPCLLGTAEAIPLPAHSVDAVVIGSAWHWMDAQRTGAELARVLRPGGVLGLSWNGPDRSVDWVVALYAVPHTDGERISPLVRSHDPEHPGHGFGPLEEKEFRWSRPMTREQLFAEQTTHSGWLLADPDTRARWSKHLGEQLDRDPHTAGHQRIDVPQRVRAYRCTLGVHL